jgi:predicted alpha/beta-hydrolase family hydrolase
MGGRYASMVVGAETDALEVLGLCLLGYPLHPIGRPERLRDEHFPRIAAPVLFVSGTRDALGSPVELRRAARRLRGPVAMHWLKSADHGFRPLKASGRTLEEMLAEAAAQTVTWVQGLPV